MTHYILLNPLVLQGVWFLSNSQIWRQANPSEAVLNAITSVGLAGLSNVKRDEQMMLIARQKYASAIHLTRQALADPLEIKKDRTLRAVALLAFFEVHTNTIAILI
jgi:hypothetical protein